MYVRFVVDQNDEDSNQRKGIFQAISCMKKQGAFYEYELGCIAGIMDWFDKNLESPFDYLNQQKSRKSEAYISWFIDSATEHISKIREFAFLVESKGVSVYQLRTESPGKIVYADKYQVLAKPFKRF